MKHRDLEKNWKLTLKMVDYERANPGDFCNCVICQGINRVKGFTSKTSGSGRVEWVEKNSMGELETVHAQLSASDIRTIRAFDASKGKTSGAEGYVVTFKPPFKSAKSGYKAKTRKPLSARTLELRNNTRIARKKAGVRGH